MGGLGQRIAREPGVDRLQRPVGVARPRPQRHQPLRRQRQLTRPRGALLGEPEVELLTVGADALQEFASPRGHGAGQRPGCRGRAQRPTHELDVAGDGVGQRHGLLGGHDALGAAAEAVANVREGPPQVRAPALFIGIRP